MFYYDYQYPLVASKILNYVFLTPSFLKKPVLPVEEAALGRRTASSIVNVSNPVIFSSRASEYLMDRGAEYQGHDRERSTRNPMPLSQRSG